MDSSEVKKGRSFNCETCPPQIQKLRKCKEDREDFTSEDSNVFPMRINDGGFQYGFCPAKATWNPLYTELFNILIISAKTGALLKSGGVENQPSWYIELLAEFLILYDQMNFIHKAKMILGDDKKNSGVSQSLNKRGLGHGRY